VHINATDTIDEKVFAITERKQGWFNEIFGK
jgi:hypothetical protein